MKRKTRFMLRLMMLLLPALIPSWRFFREVAPSPRVEYRLWLGEHPGPWTAARPRPDRVPLRIMLARLFWNPDWNTTLYMVSLAERVAEHECPRSAARLWDQVARGLCAPRAGAPPGDALQIRLIFVHGVGQDICRVLLFEGVPRSFGTQT